VLVVATLIVWCGWQNALLDLGSYRMPSLIPLTVYTAIVPAAGVLIMLFTIEQLVNGWKNGFEGPKTATTRGRRCCEQRRDPRADERALPAVRVHGRARHVRADRRGSDRDGVTQISMQSMIGQLFHGSIPRRCSPSVLPAGRRADGLVRRRDAE
jgi:hypothetical protein